MIQASEHASDERPADLLAEMQAGRLSPEELRIALDRISAEEILSRPPYRKPYPAAGAAAYVEAMRSSSRVDEDDRRKVGASRHQYWIWYSSVREQLDDLVHLCSVFEVEDSELFERLAAQLAGVIDRYEAADVPHWPRIYADGPDGHPHMTILQAARRDLGKMETRQICRL